MNKYLKKALVISASALMFLSVGALTNNANVQARRYHYRTSRRRSVKRHGRRWTRKNHRRNRQTKRNRKRKVRKTHRWYKARRRRGKRYRKGSRAHRRRVAYYKKINAARREDFRLTNRDRSHFGVAPLHRSKVLDMIAQERSRQLVHNDSHTDRNGDLVVTKDLSAHGYDPDIWNGENIMTNSGFGLSGKRAGKQANKQWWTQERAADGDPDDDGGHRKNIRNPDFQSIGIGATYVKSKDGWYMAQDFSDESPEEIDNGNQPSDDPGQGGSDDDGGGGAAAVAVAGSGTATATAGGGAAAAASASGGSEAVGGQGGSVSDDSEPSAPATVTPAVAQGGTASGGSAYAGGAYAQGGTASGGAGGSVSSTVGPTVGGGNGNNNSNGTHSSSSNGNTSVNDDGITVTVGGNQASINGKQVTPKGTYNQPNGGKVIFGSGNVTVQGADGSESSAGY